MKHILLAVGVLLIWTGCASAGQTVTLPVEDYKAILEKLDALQKRVDVLEDERRPEPADTDVKKQVTELKQDVDNIYDTLDEVETKSLQDRVNFGVELRTRLDNWKVKDFVLADRTTTVSESNDNFWTNRFRLNMDADITNGMQFHGRLALLKNWADSDSPQLQTDPNRAHLPSGDSDIKLDRAYIDWVPQGLPIPLAITFGRQPSSEGPPFELKENRLRQATYPALLFDGESDGIVATVGLDRYTGLKNNGLRLFYAKGYQDDDDANVILDNHAVTPLDDLNVYATFFESEIPTLSNSLMVFSYIRGNDFVDMPIGTTTNLGDMDLYGAHFQASNVYNSGFDVFLSSGLNKSHPNGSAGALGGLLSANGTDSHTGWSVYTGFRYNLPFERLNNPKLGFEYNHGSQYWFSFTQGSAELYNKLATRGDAYDIYYIQPFNKYLFARSGYTFVDYDYTGSGFHIGQPQSTNGELRNFYILLDARF